MSRFFNGGANVLRETTGPTTTTPITLSAWYNIESIASTRSILSRNAVAGDFNHVHQLRIQGTTGTLQAVTRSTSEVASNASSGFRGLGTWNHACGVFASNVSRTAFLNGIAGPLDTDDRTANTQTATLFGCSVDDGSSPFLGKIAHPAIWNVALTPAEVAKLAAGVSPLMVRRESLIRYIPRFGSNLPELDVVSGGLASAWIGSTSPHADEPPAMRPRRKVWTFGEAEPVLTPIVMTWTL